MATSYIISATMSLLQMTGLECEPNNEELIKDDDWLETDDWDKKGYRVASYCFKICQVKPGQWYFSRW